MAVGGYIGSSCRMAMETKEKTSNKHLQLTAKSCASDSRRYASEGNNVIVVGSGDPTTLWMAERPFYPSKSSKNSTARRMCGITIEPPTTIATLKISKNSSEVTPLSWHFII